MRIFAGLSGLILACFSSATMAACMPDALGTHRVMEVDTSKYREIQGHEKSFGLRHKEVVLTFDDGPIAGKTPRILKTLKKECVKATFFYVGRMAKVYPRLVRKVVADGHTLAHHTHAHNRLPTYSSASASHHIDRGIRTLQKIAYSDDSTIPRIPFFRYPYLARNKSTDRILARKGLIAFGANIDSLDWKRVSGSTVHNRIMRQLRQKGKGIILMHDIQSRTASMLPRLLRSLKDEGYKVVHIVPKGGARPQIQPDSDPVVVASLEPQGVPAFPSDKGSRQDREVERLTREAERDVRVTLGEPDVVKQVKVVKQEPVQRRKQVVEEVAVDTAALIPVVKTPSEVARVRKHQLSKKRKQRLARIAALEPLNRRRVPKSTKRRVSVLAGGSKKSIRKAKRRARKRAAKRIVMRGNWKLRRSQWIIN